MAVTVLVTTLCGFCGTGNHKRCSIGVKHKGRHEKYPNGVVWACRCTDGGCTEGRRKCAVCYNTNTEEVDPQTWECADVEACRATIAAKRENSPFLAQLRDIQEKAKMAKIENDQAKASSKPKTGTCVCGCKGTTKGGKFLPGHDARFVSSLVTTVAEANFTKASEQAARKSLKDVGASDALQGKFEKSVGIARDKRDKAEAAAKEKAAAKAS